MVSSESLGFRITCFIIVTLVAAFILAVLIYFNQAKNCANCCLTVSEINTMMVLGGILFIIIIFLWIWCLIRLFFVRRDRAEVNAVVYKKAAGPPPQPKPVSYAYNPGLPAAQQVVTPLNIPPSYSATPLVNLPPPAIPATPYGYNLTPTSLTASSIPINTTLSLADSA